MQYSAYNGQLKRSKSEKLNDFDYSYNSTK